MAQRGSTRRSTNIEGRLRILMMRSPCFIIQERNGCLEGRNRYMPYLVEENVCSVCNLWSISISIIISILYDIIVFGKCFEYFTCKFWLFWIENVKWVCYEVIVIVFTLTSETYWAWYFLVNHEQTMDLMSWWRNERRMMKIKFHLDNLVMIWLGPTPLLFASSQIFSSYLLCLGLEDKKATRIN